MAMHSGWLYGLWTWKAEEIEREYMGRLDVRVDIDWRHELSAPIASKKQDASSRHQFRRDFALGCFHLLRARMLAPRACGGRIPLLGRRVLSRHLITSPSKTVQSSSQSADSPSHKHTVLSSHSRTLRAAPPPSRFFHSSPPAMSIDSITATLTTLSITPAAAVSHAQTNSPQSWREALEASSSAPQGFELIKTLVYKPKTAKTATPVPVFVIARESSDVPSGVLGKHLNLKELRLASEDLLKEFFSLDKNSREYSFNLLKCVHHFQVYPAPFWFSGYLRGLVRAYYARACCLTVPAISPNAPCTTLR